MTRQVSTVQDKDNHTRRTVARHAHHDEEQQ